MVGGEWSNPWRSLSIVEKAMEMNSSAGMDFSSSRLKELIRVFISPGSTVILVVSCFGAKKSEYELLARESSSECGVFVAGAGSFVGGDMQRR